MYETDYILDDIDILELLSNQLIDDYNLFIIKQAIADFFGCW